MGGRGGKGRRVGSGWDGKRWRERRVGLRWRVELRTKEEGGAGRREGVGDGKSGREEGVWAHDILVRM